MRERPRISRGTVGRHSRTMAKGRGDARDHRRENQRLTEKDLDRTFLQVNKDGKITLSMSRQMTRELSEALAGAGTGLRAGQNGKLELNLGSSLGMDAQGRLAVAIGDDVKRVKDTSGGTVSGSGTITGADANSIATLSAKVNEILNALGTKT